MYSNFKEHLNGILSEIRGAGLYKNERVIDSLKFLHLNNASFGDHERDYGKVVLDLEGI